ncbi:uncharacterized protein [Hetaerina americana]|uniref:uncharacterized protein n=1 Tax=Hetaerina americana TaxID=62018 RepID=UPI003A7F1BE0
MSAFSGGTLVLVTPSDNAWRSKNYNMLIKDQRLLSEMASLAEDASEWDTSITLPPSTFRAATTAGLLDNETLEKLGLGHLMRATPSEESAKLTYSSSLLIDTKSILSGEESSGSLGRNLSTSDQESEIEIEGFVIPPTKLAKALRLLSNPPIPTVFDNEEEMLQVYQLIYDALRYRIVFDQTLEATSFFDEHPELRKQERVVHILFFDLQQRYFLSRDSYTLSEAEKVKDLSELIFEPEETKKADIINTVKKVEDLLWELRVHLAAAVARLRIKRHAFYLIHLLPEHLRGPSHLDGSAKRALSLWVNNFLIRKETVDLIFRDSGIRLVEGDFPQPRSSSIEILEEMAYFYDKTCMNLLFCHPYLRGAITHSRLVKENRLVIQDRSFCVGPALLCSRLSEWGISGSVVQTHISSVRVTAYLASLLNEYKSELAVKPEVVLAFGAGERKTEYEASLQAMGITNVIVYAESWIKIATTVIQALVNASANYEATYPNIAISPDFTYSCIPIPIDMGEVFEQLDNVVAVYATPPNTYSAVPDPVELAVSRGGDMKLLEEITRNTAAKYEIAYEDILQSSESKEDQEYLLSMINKEREKEEMEEKKKLSRLNKEQWEVLSLCLSLPQTQVVVYETHSMKTSENKELVDSAVNSANNAAMANFKNYMEEKSRIQKEDDEQDDQAEKEAKEAPDPGGLDDAPQTESKPSSSDNAIPSTDLFEVEDIPTVKETSKEDGCNISLIKRKEFVLLNNRYLIQMAEARGLFGQKVEEKVKSPSESAKGSKQKRKTRTLSEESDNSADFGRSANRNKEMELERISAPTVASLRRSRKWSSKRTLKTSKEEGEISSDDDYEKFVCGRCVSRGEDECHHPLKMEVVDDVPGRGYEGRNSPHQLKFEVSRSPIFISSNWEMETANDPYFKAQNKVYSTPIVNPALRSTSENFGTANSIGNMTRESKNHLDKVIPTGTPSNCSMHSVSKLTASPEASKMSLATHVTGRAKAGCEVEVFYKIQGKQKSSSTIVDILSLDEEEGLIVIPQGTGKSESTEKQVLDFQSMACVSPDCIESKNSFTCENNDNESIRSTNNQADGKESEDEKKVQSLKSTLIKFHYPGSQDFR